VKLRAEIKIEIDADDYIEAADHQRQVAALFQAVKASYGDADLSFRQLRTVSGMPSAATAARGKSHFRHATGNLSIYEEA
jgi:hypothetical protein